MKHIDPTLLHFISTLKIAIFNSYQETEIPESGALDFRITVEDDPDRCLGPAETTSRPSAVMGPDKDLRTCWVINLLQTSIGEMPILCTATAP